MASRPETGRPVRLNTSNMPNAGPVKKHRMTYTRYNKLCGRPPHYAPAPCKLTFDLESSVRVTCDVGYLCANFSLRRRLCSRLRPDVRDRQMSDRRQTRSLLNTPYARGGGIMKASCAMR